MGVKEATCDEPWILYVSDESLNSTPETYIALYVNQKLNKKFLKKEFLPKEKKSKWIELYHTNTSKRKLIQAY